MRTQKIFFLALVAVVLLSITITVAHNTDTRHSHIKTLGVLGKGIAIDSSDASNFKLIKVGVAAVRIALLDEETEIRLGVLFLDDDRYTLKNVVIGNGTTSGDVYKNDTQVGSFNATLVIKGDNEIWYGTLSIGDKNYNVYILEGERKIKADESGEKIREHCADNPERCRDLARGIGNRFCEKVEDESCREKIEEFCEENPTDQRCVSVFRTFCKDNINDMRCRKELSEICEENPTNEACTAFCEKYPRKCGLATNETEVED